jgi:hypothetical protein
MSRRRPHRSFQTPDAKVPGVLAPPRPEVVEVAAEEEVPVQAVAELEPDSVEPLTVRLQREIGVKLVRITVA